MSDFGLTLNSFFWGLLQLQPDPSRILIGNQGRNSVIESKIQSFVLESEPGFSFITLIIIKIF